MSKSAAIEHAVLLLPPSLPLLSLPLMAHLCNLSSAVSNGTAEASGKTTSTRVRHTALLKQPHPALVEDAHPHSPAAGLSHPLQQPSQFP